MFCPKCGRELKEGANACAVCGHEFGARLRAARGEPNPVVLSQKLQEESRPRRPAVLWAAVAALAIAAAVTAVLVLRNASPEVQVLDFEGVDLPQGWSADGCSFADGRASAEGQWAECRLSRLLQPPTGPVGGSIVLSWDANVVGSYRGAGTGASITLSSGLSLTIRHGVAEQSFPGARVIWVGYETHLEPLTTGSYHHEVRVDDGGVDVAITPLDRGGPIQRLRVQLPRSYVAPESTVEFFAATDGETLWLDNLQVRKVTPEPA